MSVPDQEAGRPKAAQCSPGAAWANQPQAMTVREKPRLPQDPLPGLSLVPFASGRWEGLTPLEQLLLYDNGDNSCCWQSLCTPSERTPGSGHSAGHTVPSGCHRFTLPLPASPVFLPQIEQ